MLHLPVPGRESQLKRNESPLEVGDTVTYNNHVAAFGIAGIVVERVGQDLLRVKWGDLLVPTTHRSHSLRRAAPPAPSPEPAR